MKKSLKLKIGILVAMLAIIMSSTILAASNNIILKEDIVNGENTTTQYLIYIPEKLGEKFEFALGSEDNGQLIYVVSAEDSVGNNVAYVDETNKNQLNQGGDTYIFVRKDYTETAENMGKIDLNTAFYKDFVESTTKRISVDTTKSNTTIEMIDGVKTEVTKGKVVITDSEDAKYSYILVKLPTDSENDYTELMNLAEKIANLTEEDELMDKLEIMNKFNNLYKTLEPAIGDSQWIEVENMEILQPEDSKNGEKYIVFIKSENGNEIITDAQFMTCYDEYNPLYEKEMVTIKETSKLPVTVDNMIPFVIALVVIIVAIILVLVIKKKANKKEENK